MKEDMDFPTSEKSAAAKADFDDLPSDILLREGRKLGAHYAQIKVLAGANYNLDVYAWSNSLQKMVQASFAPEMLRAQITEKDPKPGSQVELAQFVTKKLHIMEREGGEHELGFPEAEEEQE
jgi:hypothetical protein